MTACWHLLRGSYARQFSALKILWNIVLGFEELALVDHKIRRTWSGEFGSCRTTLCYHFESVISSWRGCIAFTQSYWAHFASEALYVRNWGGRLEFPDPECLQTITVRICLLTTQTLQLARWKSVPSCSACWKPTWQSVHVQLVWRWPCLLLGNPF